MPGQVTRVMAADPVAAVLVAVLAPRKLVGWPTPLLRGQRRLPMAGGLAGPEVTITPADVARWHPDLILAEIRATETASALADRIEAQTGVPFVLVEGSIERSPAMLREIGALLGVGKRGEDLAAWADHAIADIRGRMLIEPPNTRPRVYYGKGPDGLTTPHAGSRAIAAIDESGSIDVAAPDPRGAGGEMRLSPTQLLDWNPDIVIAEDRSFANQLRRDPQWRGLKAVRNRRIYVAPVAPFGWIDDPPGINRLIGLYWLSALLYPGDQPDLGTSVSDFYEKFYGTKLNEKQLAALVHSAEAKPGEFGQTTGGPELLAPGATLNPILPGQPPPATLAPGRRQPVPTAPPTPLTPVPGSH